MPTLFTPLMSMAAAPAEVGTTQVGGASIYRVALPDDCLGGMPGPLALRAEDVNPLIVGAEHEHPGDVTTRTTWLRLFSDLTSAQRTAGKIDYRMIFLMNIGTSGSVNVWLTQPRSGTGAIALWKPTPLASGYVERLTNETTSPTGPTFTAPTDLSPLNVGTISTGSSIPLFIRRTINAGTAAYAYDYFKLTLSISGSVHEFVIFYTMRSAAASATISGAKDRGIVTAPEGDIYTVTVLDSSGAAVDPAGSRVYASFAASLYRPRYGPSPAPYANPVEQVGGFPDSAQFTMPATRTAQGIYVVDFKPPHPGHYGMRVDIGGELLLTRGINVSPVGANA